MLNKIFKIFLLILAVSFLLFIGYWAGTKKNFQSENKTSLGNTAPGSPPLNKPLKSKNKKPSSDSNKTSPPTKKGEATSKKNSIPQENSNSKDSSSPPEKKSKQQKADTKSEKSKVPDAQHLSYTISVKAYLDRQEAEELKKALDQKGYSAYIFSIWDNHKKLWHSVRVGHYPNYDEAIKETEKFSLKTRLPAKVLSLGSLESFPEKFFKKKQVSSKQNATAPKK